MGHAPSSPDHTRIIRAWLLAVAACVFLTLVIGGATRLTESGLSIVEWKPVTGVFPPLSDGQWQAEFAKYQTIPQYRALNRGMTLGEFKTIYWWEWTHRLAARLAGAVFLLPFLAFLWRDWIQPDLRPRLWGIFGLGALQGMVGWWMVASGLEQRIDVSQYRLALHLTLACVLYVAVVWTAVRLTAASPGEIPGSSVRAPGRIRAGAVGVLVLVLAQIYLGALVAGLDAGLIYNTWPLIDGHVVPPAEALFSAEPAWRNLFENRLTVQFDHRMVAYALLLAATAHALDVVRTCRNGHTPRTRRVVTPAAVLAAAVVVQASLGIMTSVFQAPLALALVHQAMAILVLTLAAVHAAKITSIGASVIAGPVAVSSAR